MFDAFDSPLSRRGFLSVVAGTALAVFRRVPARAQQELIGRLILQSREFPALSKRIDFISAALLGKRYRSGTLIGGPHQKELFVVRDDGFDCVTYCETVLAAANAHDLPSFEAALRAIRYRNGEIGWRERNHDFAAWCERNVANGLCRVLSFGVPVELKKSIGWPRGLGRRNYAIAAVLRAALMANKDSLTDGDLIGFVSMRPALDYFHTGFVVFGKEGEFLLRHASQSHGRVVDQRIEQFLAANRVRYVTLLRPQDRSV
jgi:hypothetical protein